ncbi:unnamed protein product [Mytilus coruscus]|uniref:Reverse transcriptase Ty1/copia-type domain-containing protein n=1 Tax=Mytilus coruscus TaxID=42192 RepID=A0A6J8ER54_MYTCO|nr:unnamed protein product [Mytilus coruscus]
MNSVDIKTAFLQGEKMQREVYLRPPKEVKANGKVCRLNKCVYGLADASLKCYEKIKTTLLDCEGTVSKIDSAVFYWHDEKGLTGVLAVHVDDFFGQAPVPLREVLYPGLGICSSTLASEALALGDGVDCVISLAVLFKELMHNGNNLKHIAVNCFVDNKDLYHAIYSNKPVGEKRLRVKINAIKQLLQDGELKELKWIQTNEQIANVLTKHGISGQDITRCFKKGLLNSSLL